MILIVGSTHSNTANYYKKLSLPKSDLFTGIYSDATVYHTSVADCADLANHIEKFDKVVWAESAVTEFNNYNEYFDSLVLIRKYTTATDIVRGIADPYNIKPTPLSIKNTQDSAIFLGCSHTAGIGLDNEDDNYVELVSNHFDQVAINLGAPGLGNFKSFERFNQIDFFNNQIVVLQLTDIARMQMFFNDSNTPLAYSQLYNINDSSYIKVFNDKQLLYMMLDRLDLVVKCARALKMRMVIFNLGGNPNFENSVEQNFLRRTTEYYLQDYPEYIPNMLKRNVDRGNDGLHFGPKSHKIWSESIIEKINTLYQ